VRLGGSFGAMAIYVTGLEFPFIFDLPDGDDRDVLSAQLRSLNHDSESLTMAVEGLPGETNPVLVDFARFGPLLVGEFGSEETTA
jgi:hypothetical protein